jgi:hypothetical protein
MRTLRGRHAQGFARGALEFRDGGEDAVIVVSHSSEIGGSDWPAETATVMRFQGGKVVSIQDYRTERRALPEAHRLLDSDVDFTCEHCASP